MTDVGGRPSVYSEEVAEEICKRHANGESLRQITRDPRMPADSTVRLWIVNNRNGFSARYAKAREAMYERWAEEIVEIADDATNDWMQREEAVVLNSEHVNRSRLRVDTRKWLLSKLMPKQYGDKHEVTGKDGGPIEMKHSGASDEDRIRALELLLAKRQAKEAE